MASPCFAATNAFRRTPRSTLKRSSPNWQPRSLAGKLQYEMAKLFDQLRQQSKPEVMLKSNPKHLPTTTPPANAVVAYLHGNQPVTREELGEFLIARFGSEKVEFLVNRASSTAACHRQGGGHHRGRHRPLAEGGSGSGQMQIDGQFEKDCSPNGASRCLSRREDVVRPRLMLANSRKVGSSVPTRTSRRPMKPTTANDSNAG